MAKEKKEGDGVARKDRRRKDDKATSQMGGEEGKEGVRGGGERKEAGGVGDMDQHSEKCEGAEGGVAIDEPSDVVDDLEYLEIYDAMCDVE